MPYIVLRTNVGSFVQSYVEYGRFFQDSLTSITEVRIGFGDVVVTSQGSGKISRAKTSMKNYSYKPALTLGYSGDAGQALPTSE